MGKNKEKINKKGKKKLHNHLKNLGYILAFADGLDDAPPELAYLTLRNLVAMEMHRVVDEFGGDKFVKNLKDEKTSKEEAAHAVVDLMAYAKEKGMSQVDVENPTGSERETKEEVSPRRGRYEYL